NDEVVVITRRPCGHDALGFFPAGGVEGRAGQVSRSTCGSGAHSSPFHTGRARSAKPATDHHPRLLAVSGTRVSACRRGSSGEQGPGTSLLRRGPNREGPPASGPAA